MTTLRRLHSLLRLELFLSPFGERGDAQQRLSTATPSFTADLAGSYLVQLIVTDEGGLSSAADVVEISSSNQGPTAVATADFTEVFAGEQVQFDGSNSTDPEGDGADLCLDIDYGPTQKPRRSDGCELCLPNSRDGPAWPI